MSLEFLFMELKNEKGGITVFLLWSVNQMQNSPKGGTKDED